MLVVWSGNGATKGLAGPLSPCFGDGMLQRTIHWHPAALHVVTAAAADAHGRFCPQHEAYQQDQCVTWTTTGTHAHLT